MIWWSRLIKYAKRIYRENGITTSSSSRMNTVELNVRDYRSVTDNNRSRDLKVCKKCVYDSCMWAPDTTRDLDGER